MPNEAARRSWDVVIVGGGILGVCHALEATRRKLSVLLLERDDFGGATSWASHRIIHGGLRYIQSFDLRRHQESMRERRWFLAHFPDLVRPLPCLMPLYNTGLKRMDTMRAALWMNDLLSSSRNNQLNEAQRIPAGRILSAEETREWYPDVVCRGLRGAALWHDAVLTAPQRVLIELLRWACAGGAAALNYTAVTNIRRTSPSRYSISAFDGISGGEQEFCARDVINCAGSWAAQLHTETPGSGFAPPPLSLAFSVVLDRPPLSRAALAVSPRQRGGPMYFLVPFQDKVLAGTGHVTSNGFSRHDAPADEQMENLLRDVSEAAPTLNATPSTVLRTFSGLLPAARAGSCVPHERPIRRLHPSSTVDSRLLSIWGVKYTTARSTAERTLHMLFPGRAPVLIPQPTPVRGLDWSRWSATAQAREILAGIHENESVMTMEDLVYRRTDWGTLPEAAAHARAEIASLLTFDPGSAMKSPAPSPALSR